jgi:hypothetical protein
LVKIQNPKPGQFSITLPIGIMKIKRWRKGTEVFPTMNEKGEIVLKEIAA